MGVPVESANRVLHVEDNPSNIRLMERLFQERPALRLLVASDGSTARRMASEAPLSLILTDLNLPDISGENLIRALQHDLAGVTPPIVVLSADATSATIERLDALGVAEYLTKPYNVDRLLEVIDTYCPTIDTGS
jgi:CheY-like chemotaxis protein